MYDGKKRRGEESGRNGGGYGWRGVEERLLVVKVKDGDIRGGNEERGRMGGWKVRMLRKRRRRRRKFEVKKGRRDDGKGDESKVIVREGGMGGHIFSLSLSLSLSFALTIHTISSPSSLSLVSSFSFTFHFSHAKHHLKHHHHPPREKWRLVGGDGWVDAGLEKRREWRERVEGGKEGRREKRCVDGRKLQICSE